MNKNGGGPGALPDPAERQPAGPVRTCLACGKKRINRELCRFAVDKEGYIVVDQEHRLGGRGAYACRGNACIHGFLKNKKKLSRAFRRQKVIIREDLYGILVSGVKNEQSQGLRTC